MTMQLTKKINTPKATKKHSTARLEAKARDFWISYNVLLQICSDEAEKPIRDIAELSNWQIRKIEERIKKEGWRLRK